jgi:hypothetical protein
MSATNDGGPAFPRTYEFVEDGERMDATQNGMTLRDYFAGQALSGMLLVTLSQTETRDADAAFKIAAKNAYLYANAMLAARNAQGEQTP